MIFDVEADGLLNKATKIHVLAYSTPEGVKYTHDYQEMRDILLSQKVLIGHNIICYDIPVLERLLNIKIKAKLIDTLPLSWYLNHQRQRHGLEVYGEEFGVPKPKIDDWQNLTKKEYAHRCVEDVKINIKLWLQLKTKLMLLYGDKKEANRLLNYLSFKMDCLREQEASKWKLDKELATESLQTLLTQEAEKIKELASVMPKVKKYVIKTKPSKPYKKDGTLSVTGAKWFKLLKDNNLPEDYLGEVKVFHSEVDPNPGSTSQIKDWLFSLGWKPETFKYVKDEYGKERTIPQLRIEGEDGKELCPSVKKLIPNNPSVGVMEGLSVIQHRLAIFKGFLANEEDGYLVAGAAGLTNTLRFKHRVLVNLPGVHKLWGKEIRGSLVAPEGYELCGSDMCSLEETTKKHYMYPYDPEFVAEMSKPGFDAHLDLAEHAGAVTQEDIDKYNEIGGRLKKNLEVSGADLIFHTEIALKRKLYKAANYACVYGVGALKLSRETGLTKNKAQHLIDAYWARNWSVKKLCEEATVKHIGDEMWLFNPVSRFWYSLRNEKDIFSTLNQGTGVFCFDSWIREFRRTRSQLTAQFHDEVILCIKKGNREVCKKLLKDAIHKVNEKLKLNVSLDVDIQFGETYAEIH